MGVLFIFPQDPRTLMVGWRPHRIKLVPPVWLASGSDLRQPALGIKPGEVFCFPDSRPTPAPLPPIPNSGDSGTPGPR